MHGRMVVVGAAMAMLLCGSAPAVVVVTNSAQLQAALATAPDGETIDIQGRGTYTIGGVVVDGRSLSIAAPPPGSSYLDRATIEFSSAASAGASLVFRNAGSLSLSNVRIRGINGIAAMELESVGTVSISNCLVEVMQDGGSLPRGGTGIVASACPSISLEGGVCHGGYSESGTPGDSIHVTNSSHLHGLNTSLRGVNNPGTGLAVADGTSTVDFTYGDGSGTIRVPADMPLDGALGSVPEGGTILVSAQGAGVLLWNMVGGERPLVTGRSMTIIGEGAIPARITWRLFDGIYQPTFRDCPSLLVRNIAFVGERGYQGVPGPMCSPGSGGAGGAGLRVDGCHDFRAESCTFVGGDGGIGVNNGSCSSSSDGTGGVGLIVSSTPAFNLDRCTFQPGSGEPVGATLRAIEGSHGVGTDLDLPTPAVVDGTSSLLLQGTKAHWYVI